MHGSVVSDEARIVRAVLAGDKAAYGELYDQYARLVRAVCFDHTGDITEAQDLSQEVFLRAYRRLNTLRDPSRFGRWLVGMTRLVCLEWRRARSRPGSRPVPLDENALAAAETTTCDTGIEQLQTALHSLPETERAAIHAFYLQEQSIERAQALLGLSRSGMYRVLQRARRRLRRLLAKHQEDAS